MPNVFFSKIPCAEKTDSRQETWSPEAGLQVKTSLYIKWEQRYEFINDLALNTMERGWPYTPILPPTEFQRMIPVPTDISIKPLRSTSYTDDCQGIGYRIGIAEVTYKLWTPIRETVEFKKQAIRLEPRNFKWTNPLAGDPNDKQIILGIESLSQTVDRIILVREFDMMNISLPSNFYGTEATTLTTTSAANSGFVGTVHSKDYTSTLVVQNETDQQEPAGSKFVLFRAGTLLLLDPIVQEGPELYATPTPPGQSPELNPILWRKGFRWKFRWLFRPANEGHDKFWRSQKPTDTAAPNGEVGSWESITSLATNAPYIPFPSADHGALLDNTVRGAGEPTVPSENQCGNFQLDISNIPGV